MALEFFFFFSFFDKLGPKGRGQGMLFMVL